MVEAMHLVIEQRHRQLDYGHTLDRDLGREGSDRHLLGLTASEVNYTREDVTLRAGGREWRRIAIRHAAKAAALLLAFIELQLERAAQEAAEPEPPHPDQEDFGL